MQRAYGVPGWCQVMGSSIGLVKAVVSGATKKPAPGLVWPACFTLCLTERPCREGPTEGAWTWISLLFPLLLTV